MDCLSKKKLTISQNFSRLGIFLRHLPRCTSWCFCMTSSSSPRSIPAATSLATKSAEKEAGLLRFWNSSIRSSLPISDRSNSGQLQQRSTEGEVLAGVPLTGEALAGVPLAGKALAGGSLAGEALAGGALAGKVKAELRWPEQRWLEWCYHPSIQKWMRQAQLYSYTFFFFFCVSTF